MATPPQSDLGFIHRFVPATDPSLPPLLLLHGTGGDENDLIALGEQLAPGAALLSPRGKINENGMARFFRRFSEGVFDLEDLQRRTDELSEFVHRACEAYDIDWPIAVGFSNGANIAASMLLQGTDVLAGAVLLRATVPFVPETLPSLEGMHVLMLSGASDPLVPAAKRDQLAETLRDAGAVLIYEVVPASHHLSARDVEIASAWIALFR